MADSTQHNEAERRFGSYAIFPRGGEPEAVLLVSGEGGWSLPRVECGEELSAEVGPLGAAFRACFGCDVTVLRRAATGGEAAGGGGVYVLKSRGAPCLPPSGRWVSREELATLTLAAPRHRALLEAWFGEMEESEVPPRRNLWAQPGWFDEAAAWIADQLGRLGLTATGPVEQFRTWSISCILRVATSGGTLYFKAAPPMFGHEPRLTRALWERYPDRVPEVVAVDDARRWMLMREFRGERLGEVADIARWEEALRLLARMQLECVERAQWLFGLGCPDRRPERLAAQIDPLLVDTAAFVTTTGRGLSEEEIARLRALAPRLKARCAEVAAGPVPPTLVHGDLHPGNILVTEAGILIFDWTDGCVAHPFLDLVTVFTRRLPDVPDARERLRAAYLEPWTAYAPIEELVPLFERAQALGALHQAVSYQGIVANIEAVEEMAFGVPGFLKVALREMDAG